MIRSSSPAMEFPQLCAFLAELSPQPMVAVEGGTQIVRYANPAFRRLLGSEPEHLIGRPFAEAVPEGMANGCAAMLERVFRTGIAEALDEQPHGPNADQGGHAPFSYWSYLAWAILGPPEGRESEPVGVMIQVTDATVIAKFRRESVAINEALVESSVRLHELMDEATELNAALRQSEAREHGALLEAQAANQGKEIFLATLAHELRTPLGAILGWTSLLRKPPKGRPAIDAALDHGLEVIECNARAQAKLIEDVLDVARIASGKFELDCKSFDVEALVRAAVDTVRPTGAAKGLAIDVATEPDGGTSAFEIVADPARLNQAVLNLLGNAVKFTPKEGSIWVRLARITKPEGKAMRIVVADNGQGIPPALLPRVFDRFTQADALRSNQLGGLGLGLSIVRQIADLHGGSVSVHSEGQGRGAQFTLELPLVAATRRSPVAS
ncbi:PAS domain-containing sensor histidine kinase [Candidatus Binatia bacterium]|nr:PAS domain-containing sensor histidine kinase [Candidatus Binatia bacterium]